MALLTHPGPLCRQCKVNRVKTHGAVYCSAKCSNVRFRRLKPKCQAEGCPNRVHQRHNRYCSKRCAWLCRKGWEAGRKGLAAARVTLRQQYIARLRETLKAAKSPAEIWRIAYARGYQAAYQRYLRQVRRGEIVVVKERRVRWEDVA